MAIYEPNIYYLEQLSIISTYDRRREALLQEARAYAAIGDMEKAKARMEAYEALPQWFMEQQELLARKRGFEADEPPADGSDRS